MSRHRSGDPVAAPTDKVVTQIVPLRHADPDELKKLFAPLIPKSSVMVSYAPTGMLIVTDVQSNINRLLRIVEAIDLPGLGEEISLVPLVHASADTLAKSLSTLFQGTARTTKKRSLPANRSSRSCG